MPTQIIAQVLSILGAAAGILSYQMRDNRRLYIIQGISGFLFAVSFFLMGSYTSALMNVISVIRGAVLAGGRKLTKIWSYIVIQLMFIGACVATVWISQATGTQTVPVYLSVIVTVAQLIGTTTFWTRNGKIIRMGQIFAVSPMWLFNNIYVFSIGGIITEAFCIISAVVSIIRYGFNGFIDEEPVK